MSRELDIQEDMLEELSSIKNALAAIVDTLEEMKKAMNGIDYTLERAFEYYKTIKNNELAGL